VEILAAIGAIALLWWWLARRPARQDGTASVPPAAAPGPARTAQSAPPPDPLPERLEEHVRRREDAAFIEGMVVAHYVWPGRDERPAPDPVDRAELEELALTLGDDGDPTALDVEDDRFDDGVGHGAVGGWDDPFTAEDEAADLEDDGSFDGFDDPFHDGFDEDDLDDW
jgi:hypothetical protein